MGSRSSLIDRPSDRPGRHKAPAVDTRNAFPRPRRTDYCDRLDELEAGTLLVHDWLAPVFPASWSERAAESLPKGEARVYGRTGHWPPRERPKRFDADVTGFLS